MGKIDEYASGRNDGLLLALKIVEEDGVDALREEIKFRGARGINTAMSKQELNKACTKRKEMTLDTMLTLSVTTLHDEFDFGAKRCQRFIKRMNLKAECIVDDLATWDDFVEQIREELGIQITIRSND